MDSEAYTFFFEEFIYEMHELNQNLTPEIAEQLAKKKWNQLDEKQKVRYQSMARSEQIARKNNKKQLHFQINYCSSSSKYQDQMEKFSNIIDSLANQSIIETFKIPGICKSVSVFLIRGNGRPQAIWHTLKDGILNPENEKVFVSRIEDLLR